MLVSKEEPYPGRVLVSYWSDYDNKLRRYFSFAHFGYYQNLVI